MEREGVQASSAEVPSLTEETKVSDTQKAMQARHHVAWMAPTEHCPVLSMQGRKRQTCIVGRDHIVEFGSQCMGMME